jgi:hypothetical protein
MVRWCVKSAGSRGCAEPRVGGVGFSEKCSNDGVRSRVIAGARSGRWTERPAAKRVQMEREYGEAGLGERSDEPANGAAGEDRVGTVEWDHGRAHGGAPAGDAAGDAAGAAAERRGGGAHRGRGRGVCGVTRGGGHRVCSDRDGASLQHRGALRPRGPLHAPARATVAWRGSPSPASCAAKRRRTAPSTASVPSPTRCSAELPPRRCSRGQRSSTDLRIPLTGASPLARGSRSLPSVSILPHQPSDPCRIAQSVVVHLPLRPVPQKPQRLGPVPWHREQGVEQLPQFR